MGVLRPTAPPDPEFVVADQIRDILADRAAQQATEAVLQTTVLERGTLTEGASRRPMPMSRTMTPESLLNIPGLNCLDDFGTYLTDEDVRQQVINRFKTVVGDLLRGGAVVEVISHSWGTVVAYEALCQLESETLPARSVHTFFTVGSALSISPVRRRLLPEAADGHRPGLVKTWINLDARFDVVGGALQGMPFEVDLEFLGLDPVGCSAIIPNPVCAHGSYFREDNVAVNRDIFARYIRRE